MTVMLRRPVPRVLALAFLLLALVGCASAPVGAPVEDRSGGPSAQRAEQLAEEGDLDAAAQAFLDLADASRGEAQAHYRLRAAETRREAGDFDGVARALDGVQRRRLAPDEALRADLLEAELALRANDAQRAGALLMIPEGSVPPALQLRVLELRARTEAANGDRFAAARLRAQLDERLTGADRDMNRAEILAVLSALDDRTLRARATSLRPGDALLPWIEQALRGKGQVLPRDLPHPQRPVGTLIAGDDASYQREGYTALGRIALVLPLGGQVAAVAQSIRDGFLAAYYNDDSGKRPELRVYDAGATPQDAIAAYQRAVADGAGFVVGPLQREAVGQLFRQQLPVRVLALNHPDTGETPPRGSAEFSLLPEAEGAQAADRMLALGITRSAILVTEADWAERAGRAFRAQFEAHGGSITGEARVRDAEFNYKTAILQATPGLTDTSAPEGIGKVTPAGSGVFISMRPQQARLLLPQLRLAGVNVPVYASSHVHSGEVSPGMDRDLDGVEFCDATWLFTPVTGRPDRNLVSHDLPSAGGVGARLFAFGMDAYALLPYMDWLLANPDAYLDGATGQLAADSFGRIHRVLSWARFSGGVARPAQGALAPTMVP